MFKRDRECQVIVLLNMSLAQGVANWFNLRLFNLQLSQIDDGECNGRRPTRDKVLLASGCTSCLVHKRAQVNAKWNTNAELPNTVFVLLLL